MALRISLAAVQSGLKLLQCVHKRVVLGKQQVYEFDLIMSIVGIVIR